MKKFDWADARLLRRPNCLISRVRVYCRLYDFRRSIRKLRVFCLWHVCERASVPFPSLLFVCFISRISLGFP